MDFQFVAGEQTHSLRVERTEEGYAVTVNGRRYAVTAALVRPGELVLTLDGVRCRAWVAVDGPRRWVAVDGEASAPVVVSVPQATSRTRRGTAGQAEALEAQMPGVVRRVLVAEGDLVERGQVLLLLEAMKMEIRVTAPHAGQVSVVGVAEGQAVDRGQVLVGLTASA